MEELTMLQATTPNAISLETAMLPSNDTGPKVTILRFVFVSGVSFCPLATLILRSSRR